MSFWISGISSGFTSTSGGREGPPGLPIIYIIFFVTVVRRGEMA